MNTRIKLTPKSVLTVCILLLIITCFSAEPAKGQSEDNVVPVAVDDTYTTNEETTLTVPAPGILDNDTDADGDLLTAHLLDWPSTGHLTVADDGSFTYMPYFNETGWTLFTYEACDPGGLCAEAVVWIMVEDNEAPVAGDDAYTMDESTILTVPAPGILGNDSDANGDTLVVSTLFLPGNGDLLVDEDGGFTYTPWFNFIGTDSFTYEACDPGGLCDGATVTITVNPVNDPPVCSSATASVDTLWPPKHKMVPVTVNLFASDPNGDILTISITAIRQDEPVSASDEKGDFTAPDAEIVGTTANLRAERADENYAPANGRVYHITVTANDGHGGTCSSEVLVSVPFEKKTPAIDDGPAHDSTIP